MFRCYFLAFLFIAPMISVIACYGQQNETPDSNQVKQMLVLAESYFFNKPDTCLVIVQQALSLAKKLNYTYGVVNALNTAGEALRFLGDYPQALEMHFSALQINRNQTDERGEARSLGFIGLVYAELNEYRQALNYLYQGKELLDKLSMTVMQSFNLSNIGMVYEELNILDSALFIQEQAFAISLKFTHRNLTSLILTRLGIIHARMGKQEQALQYYQEALQNANKIGDKVNLSRIHKWIAESYLSLNRRDSSLYYARLAFANGQHSSQKLQILESSNLLMKLFRTANSLDSALHYQDIEIAMKDSLFGQAKFRHLQLLTLNEQKRQQELIQQQEKYKNRIRLFTLLGVLGFILILTILLYRNNLRKQKINILLQDQKNEIEETLSTLRSTQNQLIQSEKMASLGEMTAGIAHEIQNPLNFVNNFSEVNKELIADLNGERLKGKGERNEQLESQILKSIEENEEKIIHHGKKADAIVKSMLQHSMRSTGKKEPTNINALAEEYLRLSYHAFQAGLRAKDKLFNAELKLDLDSSIPLVNIIPQDIGRVLLNLFNNAFWFSSEALAPSSRNLTEGKPASRSRTEGKPASKNLTEGRKEGHQPTITLTTKKLTGTIEIRVKDNGIGIPPNIIDKIFQPFFTTKPTGQGTGLGLSLAYDIIKAHGGSINVISNYHEPGEIKVESDERAGTEFIVSFPI